MQARQRKERFPGGEVMKRDHIVINLLRGGGVAWNLYEMAGTAGHGQ
jgi:hypothetical protein